MLTIYSFIARFIPAASAATIEKLGSGSPGVDDMWSRIKSVFPHTDLGSGSVAFFTNYIQMFILGTIGAMAVVGYIMAGTKMVQGTEEGFGEGKKIITYTSLGLIAAICADGVIYYAITLLQRAAGG